MTGPILSVGDSAYREIRKDIIFGYLAPGERLRLEALKKRYEVSITTLREILNRLTSDGLVVAEGQKGFEVAPVSDEDMRELGDLRVLLESHALEKSFAAGDMEWEAAVVGAYHKLQAMEARMLAGDFSVREMWKRYDWEFHHALSSACGSRALIASFGAVFDKYLRYQFLTLEFRGAPAAQQHRELRDAALERDAEKAKRVLHAHVWEGVRHSEESRRRLGAGHGTQLRIV
jgi:DNA-binding GntR family transcriptional regulator